MQRLMLSIFIILINLCCQDQPGGKSTSLNGWIYVTSFGATANDNTDDTKAIQEAADSLKSGAILYFPPGIYRVKEVITLGGSGIVKGAGIESSVINATSPSMSVFSTLGTSGRVVFRDLKIGVEEGLKKTGGAGILLTTKDPTMGAQQSTRIENVWIDSQYRGIDITNASYWTIRDCSISRSVSDGIKVNVTSYPDGGDNLIIGCVITGVQADTAAREHPQETHRSH